MKYKDYINALQVLASRAEGTAFVYRIENNLIPEDQLLHFSNYFDDKRMALYFYNILKDISGTELSFREHKINVYDKVGTIVEEENDEGEKELAIQYEQVVKETRWQYSLIFRCTLEQIKDHIQKRD